MEGEGEVDYSSFPKCQRCKTGDLVPLSGLTRLESLFLRDNQISDAGPLVENQGLGEGDVVNLEANPLSEESLSIHIPQLQARGVSVVYDAPP